jgi:hypothetical protein
MVELNTFILGYPHKRPSLGSHLIMSRFPLSDELYGGGAGGLSKAG